MLDIALNKNNIKKYKPQKKQLLYKKKNLKSERIIQETLYSGGKEWSQDFFDLKFELRSWAQRSRQWGRGGAIEFCEGETVST